MISDTIQRDRSSYPGGKSGAGIFQRLINLVPRHRILIVPFAGHCGVVRNIKPAEHTIVIDQNPSVCQWWADWSRTKRGRALEIHNCDGIEWIRFSLGCTEYSDAGSGDGRSQGTGSRNRRLVMAKVCDRMTHNPTSPAGDAQSSGTRATHETAAEAFVFCDPPYVLSERASGRIYECELNDEDHQRFIGTVTTINAARYRVMICGYACDLYAALDPWQSIDHRVPTRGGPAGRTDLDELPKASAIARLPVHRRRSEKPRADPATPKELARAANADVRTRTVGNA